MHRFKASKFKNAAPKPPKRENWISGVSVGSPQCFGKMISASQQYMAFCLDTGVGGNVGVLPTSESGKRGNIPVLPAHSDLVTDLDFSPFCDQLLATVSQDGLVKLWLFPEDDSCVSSLSGDAAATLPSSDTKLDLCTFHTTADDVLSVSNNNTIQLWDLNKLENTSCLSECGDEQIFCMSWSDDGQYLAVTNKDKQLRVLDPRAKDYLVQCVQGHQNIKDSRVVWLDDNHLLTSGFDRMRQRQLMVWDVRSMSSCSQSVELDTSSGILMPLYDATTHMLFLCGKAESTLHYWEYHTSKQQVVEVMSHVSDVETKGACLASKRSLDVMSCEVNRVIQLSKTNIVPIPFHVPRKSYRDFHSDLFPPTRVGWPALSSRQWFAGENRKVQLSSLDPGSRPAPRRHRPKFDGSAEDVAEPENDPGKIEINGDGGGRKHVLNGEREKNELTPNDVLPARTIKPPVSPKPRQSVEKGGHVVQRRERSVESVGDGGQGQVSVNRVSSFKGMFEQKEGGDVPSRRQEKTKSAFAAKYRVSKCRHLKGTPSHKHENIENIRNLSTSVPGESDGFGANSERAVIPLSGPGGNMAVLELSKPGRLPDANIPFLHNASTVMDFTWDPFDPHRLAVACDDGRIRLWQIPPTGLTAAMHEPSATIEAHACRVVLVRFHPTSKDVLLTAGQDATVSIWNLDTGSSVIELEGHSQAILAASWSSDGRYVCTVCRDSQIRLYEPRHCSQPIKCGPGPEGNRGARCVWACDDQMIVVSGFTRTSLRILNIYDVNNLDEYVCQFDLDVSPSILMMHYDCGTSTCFLYGRGDSTVFTFEILPSSPYYVQLTSYKASGLHHAWAFLPKSRVDVRKVEFAKAVRLTKTHVETVSFTVPRVKMQYFQDDLFPDCPDTSHPSMSAAEWFSGEDKSLRLINLCPDDMRPVSGQSSRQSTPAVAANRHPTPATPTTHQATPTTHQATPATHQATPAVTEVVKPLPPTISALAAPDVPDTKGHVVMSKEEEKRTAESLVSAMTDMLGEETQVGEPKYQTEEGVDPEEWDEQEGEEN